MSTVIIYSSKYGCTEDCANYIKRSLSDISALVDINKTKFSTICIENYDTVIIGSSIYIGAISKKMQIFCKEYVDVLCTKRIGIFLCCGFSADMETYLTKNFSSVLLEKAVVTKCFGGEGRPNNMKGLDRLILKVATKGKHESLKISYENIDSFINEIQ